MDFDVAVVGAGPTGLMLAGELALHGASVVVLDRLAEPDRTIKAGAINAASLEALRRRGLLPEVLALQDAMLTQMASLRVPPGEAPPDLATMRQGMRTVGGHFGGLFKLDPSRLDPADPDAAATDGGTIAPVAQVDLERVLARHAERLGAEVRRGVEVASFEQDESGVTVRAAGGVLRARYLVGCDGGRSTVRKLTGFDFPGTDPTITGHQALAEIDHPERLPTGWNRTGVGMLVHGPQPGRLLLVQFDGPPAERDTPVTPAEIEASLRRVSGADVSITAVHSATRFTDNARQATTYRSGRVLLAGDAAHIHSPFGGQGLNLGLGDAVNLGWKLAAVAHSHAPDSLLDTYTAERHPIGARVLQITRAQVALMRPDAHTTALREVMSDLIDTEDGNAHFVKMIGGLDHHYDLPGDHPAVGRPMPLLPLSDGTTTADHFHQGGPVLFDFADSPDLRTTTANRAHVVTTKADTPLTALLVRPDGFVAWATTTPTHTSLEQALTTWCHPHTALNHT